MTPLPEPPDHDDIGDHDQEPVMRPTIGNTLVFIVAYLAVQALLIIAIRALIS